MNLFKIYSALAIVLVMCTYNAEGGIILLLLLKIIALKGALFFGMPLAIGSFMMGQGMGFFGGSLFGGYSMLNAAHKFHSSKGHHKHKGIHSLLFKGKGHPHHHTVTYTVPPGDGWGWGSRLATESPGWKAPTVHYHSYNEHRVHVPVAQPSLLSKITSIPSKIVNRFKPKRPVIVTSSYGDHGWTSAPETASYGHGPSSHSHSHGWPSAPAASHASPVVSTSYGKNPGIHTYYEDANAENEYGAVKGSSTSTSSDDVDWSQGLANLLKAAEAEAEAEAAKVPSSAYKDSDPHQESYGAPSSSSHKGSSSNYGYQDTNGDDAHPSEGGYDSGSKTLISGYNDNSGSNHYDPSQSNSYYDRDGFASEEVPSVTKAPNSVIEKFLESKLRDEMEKQKNAAEKKETAQLISMLRQVYIQELVDSLDNNGDNTGKRGVRMAGSGTTTELPDFIPFPVQGVPNSTTAKPKKVVSVTTLGSSTPTSSTSSSSTTESSTTFNPKSDDDTSVESPPTSSKNPLVRALNEGYLVGDTDDVQGDIAATVEGTDEDSARFVPMKTSWVINQRQLQNRQSRNMIRKQLQNQRMRSNAAAASNYNVLANTVRSRRQTGTAMDAQALSTFTDDVKKFFLLVSILDQDKCLQKLVCDVHTRGAGAPLTTYESNILVTFKVMNVLLPGDVEDATTNYRKAAKIGELSKSAEICGKAYPTCTYSVNQIINMGNQVAETGDVDSVTSLVSGGSASKMDDMETGASEIQVKTASATGTATGAGTGTAGVAKKLATNDDATAMPRV